MVAQSVIIILSRLLLRFIAKYRMIACHAKKNEACLLCYDFKIFCMIRMNVKAFIGYD